MSVATGSREARVHTQPSNRANAALAKGKSKASDERRATYKPVLENPHQVKWPSSPLNVQNSVLACLSDLLPQVAEYHLTRQAISRKGKTEAFQAKRQARAKAAEQTQETSTPLRASKKRTRDDDHTSEPKRTKLAHKLTPKGAAEEIPTSSPQLESPSSVDVLGNPSSSFQASKQTVQPQANTEVNQTSVAVPPALSIKPAIPVPSILNHCTFGINEVTKQLEILANPGPTDETRLARPRLRVVLACRADIDPPLLIAHLPILVAACNSSLPADSSDEKFVKLVTLPMGAEHSLAELVGLRRVAVMALDVETPGLERLEALLKSVPALRETWLAPPSTTVQELKTLVPTHVKQLKTSAPKDMKAAKEKRKREVEEAKERAKEGHQKKRRKVDPKGEIDAAQKS